MALRGIKILELAGLAPAPFCGMLLSDFGASVLRVDRVGSSPDFDVLSSGKQSIAVNIHTPAGAKIIKQLCKESDVIIEPYRRGVMEYLGLGPDVLLKENPKLIYARLTGYGQSGPFCARAGHDINYLGLSGLLSLFGRRGEKPLFPVNLASDFGGGGLMCALGILIALYERSTSGLGQVIDSNMVEGTAYLGSWLYRSRSLPIWGNSRGENYLDGGAHFYEVYETKDGKFMAVGALEPKFYANLLAGLELNYDDVPQHENFEKSKEIFTEKFKTKTMDEWCAIFDKADACVSPVLSLDEAPKHKHNLERNSFEETEEGTIIPKPAPILSRSPGTSNASKPAPKIGEHTLSILEKLGYDKEKIETLVSKDVVACFTTSKL